MSRSQAEAEERAWTRELQPPDDEPAPDPTHDPGVVIHSVTRSS